MSGTEAVPAPSAAPPRTVTRLLLTAGVTAAGWLLAALLGSSAVADELPAFDSGSGGSGTTITTPGPDQPEQAPDDAGKPAEPTPSEPAEPTTPAKKERSTPAQQRPDREPAERPRRAEHTERARATDGAAQLASPKSAPKPERAAKQDGGLLGLVGGIAGGLLGGVSGLVEDTADSVDAVLPLPGGCTPPAVLPAPDGPSILPDLGSLLPGSGSGETGAQPPAPGTGPVAPEAPSAPLPAPEDFPDRPAAAAVPVPTKQALREIQAPARTSGTAQHAANVDDIRAENGSGGGTGTGGRPAPAPAAPVGPTCQFSSAHDHSGGGRQLQAVLGSSADTTRLRMLGASRGHAATGIRNEAALPATSPD